MKTRETNEHPASGVLLLYMAHEVPERTERAIGDHLAGCWACSARVERLKQGIQAFVEARDLSHSDLPVPRPRAIALRQRLESIERQSVPSQLRAWIGQCCGLLVPSRRFGIAAGVIAPLLAVLFLMTRPPDLSASDLLRRATVYVQSDGAVQKQKNHRRIRIWSGTESIDWNSEDGTVPKHPETEASDTDWSQVLRGPVRWEDPLSVVDFQHWRDALTSVHDEIAESSALIVLTTSGRNADGILRASLTLRRSDWHAIEKTIYVDGKPPVQVKEISWELRDPSRTIFPREHKGALRERLPSDDDPAATPVAVDTGLAELQARLALFSVGVGVTGQEPGFTAHLTHNEVRIELATSSEDRRVRLQALLDEIPGVRAQVTGPDHVSASRILNEAVPPARAPETEPGHQARPMLWENLVKKLGSADGASQYSIRVLNAAARTRAIVAQIHELSLRYPAASVAMLSSEAQGAFTSLKQSMQTSLAKSSTEYNQALVPMFATGTCQSSGQAHLDDEGRVQELFQLVSERDEVMTRLFATTADSHAGTAEGFVQRFHFLNEKICTLARIQ